MQLRKTNTVEYGVSHDLGYAGFIYTADSFLANGIRYFERFDRGRMPPATHAFLVASAISCVEALAPGVVVTTGGITDYCANPKCFVMFRRPRAYTRPVGEQVYQAALRHLGERYGYGLLLADLLANSIPGRIINGITGYVLMRLVNRWCDFPQHEICSELVAKSLAALPCYSGRGVLATPANEITPQMLFDDETVFEPWDGRIY